MRNRFLPYLKRLGLALLFWTGYPSTSAALSPISYHYDLVAGGLEAGYRDGPFSQALFNQPSGLAVSADGTRLFVADQGNHRVRVIRFDDRNEVATLAGDGRDLTADGSLHSSSFQAPALLAYLPDEKLALYDSGSNQIRLLDLKKNRTATIPPPEGKDWGRVGALVVDPSGKFLLVTRIDLQSVLRLDPATGKTVELFSKRPEVPNPNALTLETVPAHDGKPAGVRMVVGDYNNGEIYGVEWDGNTTVGAFREIGHAPRRPLVLVNCGDRSYTFQGDDYPWLRLEPAFGEVHPESVSGAEITAETSSNLNLFLHVGSQAIAGAAAAPGQDRCVLLSLPYSNAIISLRDYDDIEDRRVHTPSSDFPVTNPDMVDYGFPTQKPPNTFRLLLLGDSRLFFGSGFEQGKIWPWGFNIQDDFPKKMEMFLNLMGGLEDVPEKFQVLTVGRYRWECSLFLWPIYWGAEQPAKYDVDMVLMFMPSDINFQHYTNFKILGNGLPDIFHSDPEFQLKPLKEKMELNPDLKTIYDAALEKGIVNVKDNNWLDSQFNLVVQDPRARAAYQRLVLTPMRMYLQHLKETTPKGRRTPEFAMVFFPLGNLGDLQPVEAQRDFWKGICRELGVRFLDLTETWNAVRVTGEPVAEESFLYHLTNNGHSILGPVLGYELIHAGFIPWKPAGGRQIIP